MQATCAHLLVVVHGGLGGLSEGLDAEGGAAELEHAGGAALEGHAERLGGQAAVVVVHLDRQLHSNRGEAGGEQKSERGKVPQPQRDAYE